VAYGVLALVGLRRLSVLELASSVLELPSSVLEPRSLAIHPGLRRVLIAIGVSLLDAAAAVALHGVWQAGAWTVGAVGAAWLLRRTSRGDENEPWLDIALGAHVGLVLLRAVVAGVSAGATGDLSVSSAVTVGLLAATCLGCARLTGGERDVWRPVLDGLGLIAVGYATSATLHGTAKVGGWAFEALALVELGRRAKDRLAWYGGIAFLGLACLHVVVVEAPLRALVAGAPDLAAAAIALGAVSVVSARAAVGAEPASFTRGAFLAGAALAALYLASVAVVTAVLPMGSTAYAFDLSVHQLGQMLVSALWGLAGMVALIVGLRRRLVGLRLGALGLLFLAAGKVFLFDLAALDSVYRVGSVSAFGILALAAAFAHQRLRPPSAPDFRSLHPSQR
jgi:hypothetical protein